MTDGNRSKRNKRIRILIAKIVNPMCLNQRIKTEKVLTDLQKQDSRWCLDSHQVANLIRERDDLKWISDGTWEKVRA